MKVEIRRRKTRAGSWKAKVRSRNLDLEKIVCVGSFVLVRASSYHHWEPFLRHLGTLCRWKRQRSYPDWRHWTLYWRMTLCRLDLRALRPRPLSSVDHLPLCQIGRRENRPSCHLPFLKFSRWVINWYKFGSKLFWYKIVSWIDINVMINVVSKFAGNWNKLPWIVMVM